MGYPAVGNISHLTCSFTKADGSKADPEVVEVELKDPAGMVSIFTPLRSGAGDYYYDLLLTESGRYRYRFIGTSSDPLLPTAQSSDRWLDVPAPRF